MAGVYILWAVLSLVSALMDGVLNYGGALGSIRELTGVQVADVQGAGVAAIPLLLLGFAEAFIGMLSWNYAMYNNPVGDLMKMTLLYPITFIGVVNIVLLLVRVTSSTASTVAVAAGALGGGVVGLANLVGGGG